MRSFVLLQLVLYPKLLLMIKFVHANEATLLGAPIGDVVCIDQAIGCKIEFLKTMGFRLCHFKKHDALLLLRHALAIPKVLYLLRSSPCFLSPRLQEFDSLLLSTHSLVLNVDLSRESAWLQATLPVSHGEFGVRSASMFAPSAYHASAAGCRDLITRLLPSYNTPNSVPLAIQA